MLELFTHHWADLTTRHCADLAAHPDVASVVAILPVAATEQHGPHLPLSVDTLLVEGVIAAALPHLGGTPALFMPTQAISLSTEHTQFAGTLSLSPQTVIALWMEIGACVARSGIKKLVLLNSHGGNVGLMDVVARELRSAHGLIVYHTSWYNLPLLDAGTGEDLNTLFSKHEHRFGVHAGEIETSMMLALRPDLVAMHLAENFHSTSEDRAKEYPILGNGKSAKLGWQMQDYNAAGAAGNATAATAAKGQALLDSAGLQLAQLLAEISRLPLSTLASKPSA